MDCALLALSGGIDSVFLLHISREILGGRIRAATIRMPYTLDREVRRANHAAAAMGVRHEEIRLSFSEELRRNPPDHCYLCKRRLFSRLKERAAELGILWVMDGTNIDDLGMFRPGLRALREMGIRSPLAEAGLTKADIRQLARKNGLAGWDLPPDSCLLSRLPVDAPVDVERFRDMEAAEDLFIAAGFPEIRIRCHGDLARVEAPPEKIPELAKMARKKNLPARLRRLGFRYITVDLEGYRPGTMDGFPARPARDTINPETVPFG